MTLNINIGSPKAKTFSVTEPIGLGSLGQQSIPESDEASFGGLHSSQWCRRRPGPKETRLSPG